MICGYKWFAAQGELVWVPHRERLPRERELCKEKKIERREQSVVAFQINN